MQMNYIECPGCGKKVHDGAPACPECGTKIDVEEPADIKGVRHPPLDLPPPRRGATGSRDVKEDSKSD